MSEASGNFRPVLDEMIHRLRHAVARARTAQARSRALTVLAAAMARRFAVSGDPADLADAVRFGHAAWVGPGPRAGGAPPVRLSGRYLRGIDLTGRDLRHADLHGADLTGATLDRADLTGANLAGAILVGARLTRATLAGAVLCGADLSRAWLRGADLRGADCTAAVLRRAVLLEAALPSDLSIRARTVTGAAFDGDARRHRIRHRKEKDTHEPSPVLAPAFDSDGGLVASFGARGAVSIFDTAASALLRLLPGQTRWEPPAGVTNPLLPPDPDVEDDVFAVATVALSPSGATAAVMHNTVAVEYAEASASAHVEVFDVVGGRGSEVLELPGGRGDTSELDRPSSALEFSPDGRHLVALSRRASVLVASVAEPVHEAWSWSGSVDDEVCGHVAVSPCSRRLAVACRPVRGPDEPAAVWVFDLVTGAPLRREEAGAGRIAALAFTAGGDAVAVTAGRGFWLGWRWPARPGPGFDAWRSRPDGAEPTDPWRWLPHDGAPPPEPYVGKGQVIAAALCAAAGTAALVLLGEPSTVTLLDLSGWAAAWSAPIDAGVVTALRLSADGRRLLVVHRDIVRSIGTVDDRFCWSVFDTDDGSLLWSAELPEAVDPQTPVFSPDGTLVGAGGVRTRFWDAATGAETPAPGGRSTARFQVAGLCPITH